MFSSRSVLIGLLSLGFAADPAFATPIIYYPDQSPAEACAAGVAEPGSPTPGLKSVCEKALAQPLLSRKDKAATLANMGIVNLRLGKLDEALDHLEQARQLDPANGDIAISLGATLIRLERAGDAIRLLSEMDRISPDNIHLAYYNRALAHWALEDAESAYRDFRASAAIKPGFRPAETALSHFEIAAAD